MKRLLLITVTLLLLPPLVALSWLTATESGLHWISQHLISALPGTLTMSSLKGSLAGTIIVQDIRYQQDELLIQSDRISMAWSPMALLMARIHLDHFHSQSLKVKLPQSAANDQTSDLSETKLQKTKLPEIELPWRLLIDNVILDQIEISKDEQSFNIDQIRLSMTTLLDRVDLDTLSLKTGPYELNLTGDLSLSQPYAHQLNTRWLYHLTSTQTFRGEGELLGNLLSTDLTQRVSGPMQVTLNLNFKDLLQELKWQGNAEILSEGESAGKSEGNSQIGDDWPDIRGNLRLDAQGDLDTAQLHGLLDGNYSHTGPFNAEFKLRRQADASIDIEQLHIHTVANSGHLYATGLWQPGDDAGRISAALHWKNLRWPVNQTAWFDSAYGSAWIEGGINDYQFGIASDRPFTQAPPSLWLLSADGTNQGLRLHSLRILTLHGAVNTKGKLGWTPNLHWQTQSRIHNIDPGTLWPDWTGKLKGEVISSGATENSLLTAKAHIKQIKGKLRGYPVHLQSRLDWKNDGLDITQFQFNSGTSKLKAQGRLADSLKLDWRLDSENISHLLPHSSGQLQSEGQLRGTRESPVIHSSVSGKELSFPDIAVGDITAELSINPLDWKALKVKLNAAKIKYKAVDINKWQMQADSNSISSQIVSPEASAKIELKGKAIGQGWQGRVHQVNIMSSKFKDWNLVKPAVLNIDKSGFSLGRLCWASGEASICTKLQQQQTSWISDIQIQAFPLEVLSPWISREMKIQGAANANAELSYRSSDSLSAQAQIQFLAGVITYPLFEDEQNRWNYDGGTLQIQLDKNGLKAASKISIKDNQTLQASVLMPGFSLSDFDPNKQLLQGEARVELHDLGFVAAMVPEVQNLKGSLGIDFSVSGSLAQPKLKGQALINKASLQIPRLGLSIDQLSLKGQSSGLDKFNIRVNAHSGGGQLAIESQTILDKKRNWATKLAVKGKDFEIVRIPEARMQVSPDLRINIEKPSIDVSGEVHIAEAKLQPKDISTAAQVSDDVVMVNQDQPVIEKWLISSKVRLTLGKKVNFYGFGFEGRLGGNVLLEDRPGQLTKATGQINVEEGRYRAYGQRLNVKDGKLLYTGGTLTNPGLDFRAVRQVGNVTAGLKVKGSLNQPQIDLFSIPAMGQTDALAYLLIGRPIENSSSDEGAMMAKAVLALGLSGGNRLVRSLAERFGLDEMRVESSDTGEQAYLVVGRYLSPKLYVSYGVGLLESVNTFNVRYQITDKWQLKGESGERHGADFLYTIER